MNVSSKRWLQFTLIFLLGAALRIHALGQDFRFHPDEAFFSTFARSAATRGEWMLPGALDKTPLSIYAAALSMHFVATYTTPQQLLDVDILSGEFATRLPNVFASLLLIALVYRLTRQFHNHAALSALLLAAVSPYLLVFSASGFTDVWMVMLMVASLVAAAENCPGWSGLWLGLSLWAKQQGIFYLPLVVGVLWVQPQSNLQWEHRVYYSRIWFLEFPIDYGRRWVRFSLPFVIMIALLVLWDSLRPDTSLFTLASINNNPGHLWIRTDELLPRLKTWFGYIGWTLGFTWITFLLIGVGLAGVLVSRHKAVRLIGGYVLMYLVGHWLAAFNTYDRYLLPIVPLVIILVAVGLSQLSKTTYQPFALVILLLALIGTGIQASRGNIHLGRDGVPRQNTMIELGTHLNDKPLGAIIYDRWLGWELGYYLGEWTDKRRTYYPSAEILAEDALLNPDPAPRFFVAPDTAEVNEWLHALRRAGFEISADFSTENYHVYEIIPP